MSKPTIYWSSMNGDELPSNQDDCLWNREPDADNTTHLGTKFVGDEDAASVGLDLGAMTNLQEGDDFLLLISHTAEEPITNVQFYYTVSTNVRGDATGFANEDDDDRSGVDKDFGEIRAWGDGKLTEDGDVLVDNDDYLYGMRIRFDAEVDPTFMATDQLDALESSKILTNDGKWSGAVGTKGDSPEGEESWIEPFSDYVSNDAAVVQTSLSIPDIENAGVRSVALTMRLTYTFFLSGFILLSALNTSVIGC